MIRVGNCPRLLLLALGGLFFLNSFLPWYHEEACAGDVCASDNPSAWSGVGLGYSAIAAILAVALAVSAATRIPTWILTGGSFCVVALVAARFVALQDNLYVGFYAAVVLGVCMLLVCLWEYRREP
jgi:hypothetical protein